jgi:hypothetical protein
MAVAVWVIADGGNAIVAVAMPGTGVPTAARAVCVAIFSRSLILPGVVVVTVPIGVVNKLLEFNGVLVTAGGVE